MTDFEPGEVPVCWFAPEEWGAPVCRQSPRVNIPVGEICASCGEYIETGQSGIVNGDTKHHLRCLDHAAALNREYFLGDEEEVPVMRRKSMVAARRSK